MNSIDFQIKRLILHPENKELFYLFYYGIQSKMFHKTVS